MFAAERLGFFLLSFLLSGGGLALGLLGLVGFVVCQPM